jgi:repressor LexA
MSGAGILPGDLVVVEKGRTPRNGDIVIAEVDGRYTMKSFFRERGRVTLEAANPKYPTLVPQSEMRLIGVVTACVRKYAL